MSTKWFCISKELELTELKQPDISLSNNTKYWLQLIDEGRFHETSHGNIFPLYNYKIFNAFLEPTVIKEFNLSCDTLYDTAENVFGTNMTWIIKDSIGKEFKMYFGSRGTSDGIHREEAILQGIKFMKEYGQFHYDESINLALELNKLKIENKEVFERMQKAESELKLIKSQS